MTTENPEDSASQAPTFEDALDELQQIVDELEEGTPGLEESMRHFEKGMLLLQRCYQILQHAEQKIEVLTGTDEKGNSITEPYDGTATIDGKKSTAGRRGKTKKAEPDKTEHDGDTLF